MRVWSKVDGENGEDSSRLTMIKWWKAVWNFRCLLLMRDDDDDPGRCKMIFHRTLLTHTTHICSSRELKRPSFAVTAARTLAFSTSSNAFLIYYTSPIYMHFLHIVAVWQLSPSCCAESSYRVWKQPDLARTISWVLIHDKRRESALRWDVNEISSNWIDLSFACTQCRTFIAAA